MEFIRPRPIAIFYSYRYKLYRGKKIRPEIVQVDWKAVGERIRELRVLR
jgi:hypothetical protein